MRPFDIYLQAGRMKKARGYYAEARAIFEEGQRSLEAREERDELAREIKALP